MTPPLSKRWTNSCPGDLSIQLPEICATNPDSVLQAAADAQARWAATPLEERIALLKTAQKTISERKDALAKAIALEVGKPITEAQGEMNAVIAKFDFTFADAEKHLHEQTVADGPHPAIIRNRPRGIAAVIGPFNFPLHLGHGAIVAHLLAGNVTIFKPSPLAANVAADYARIMTEALPQGVFGLVQGGADEANALCVDPRVRAVCFTGSVAAGRAIALQAANDPSKELALELGGKNAVIICADADLQLAAQAVADGMCLTCGQRCNGTSRLLIHRDVASNFRGLLVESVLGYRPGFPMDPATRLGPLISEAAFARYKKLTSADADWILPASPVSNVGGREGYYVTPAIRRGFSESMDEPFAPILELETFDQIEDALAKINGTPFGLTASVFTKSETQFKNIADQLNVGNIYANLPTTFSPSTLPFGGFGMSGNGRPGGRGFIRFTTQEQAVQIAKGSLE